MMLSKNGSNQLPIVISVETYAREWIPKFRLALELTDHGNEVILGSLIDTRLYIKENEFSFYLGSGSAVESEIAPYCDTKIHTLVTEGAIYKSPSHFLRGFDSYLPSKNAILLWGIDTERLFENNLPEFEYEVTGWPRFDDYLAVYSALRDHTKSNSWHDILVGLSHSGNNFGIYGSASPAQKEDFERFMEDIIYLIESFPEKNFLIRPHPSGNEAELEPFLRGLDNVRISNGGDVGLEIVESSLVIHQNSTIGIETKLCDIPAISYYPHDRLVEGGLADQSSSVIVGTDDLIESCENPDGLAAGVDLSSLENNIININQSVKSLDLLVEYIIKNAEYNTIEHFPINIEDSVYKYLCRLMPPNAVGSIRRFNPSRRIRYSYNKFPTLCDRTIQKQLSCLCDLSGIKKPTVERVRRFENLITLTKDSERNSR